MLRTIRSTVLILGPSLVAALASSQPAMGQIPVENELQLVSPSGVAAHLGRSVDVNGVQAAIGEPVGNAVRILEWDGFSWTETAVVDCAFPQQAHGSFGASVAIREDLLVVGTPAYDFAEPLVSAIGSGAAFIYRRHAAGWTLEATLRGVNGQDWNEFGKSVDIDAGERIAVGAPNEFWQGAAYVFHRDGLLWQLEARVDLGPSSDDYSFGQSLAFHDGTLLVAAQSSVAEFVHDELGWHDDQMIPVQALSLAVEGDDLAVAGFGQIDVFERQGAAWVPVQTLVDPEQGPGDPQYPFEAIAIDGGVLLAGLAYDDVHGVQDAGTTLVFTKGPEGWIAALRLHSSEPAAFAHSGFALSMDDGRALVGAPDHAVPGMGSVGLIEAYCVAPGACTMLGHALAGIEGSPVLQCLGDVGTVSHIELRLGAACPQSSVLVVVGSGEANLPCHGGVLVPTPDLVLSGWSIDALGHAHWPTAWPAGIPAGTTFVLQAWVGDENATKGWSASNGLRIDVP